MNRNSAVAFVLVSLLALALAANTRQGEAQDSEIIIINADGTVAPASAPIQRVGNTYTLTGNFESIKVFRSNIVLDGNGYTPSDAYIMIVVSLEGVRNVTVKNFNITIDSSAPWRSIGIYLDNSSNCTITNNTVAGTRVALADYQANGGIVVRGSNFSTVTGNHVEGNMLGIVLLGAEHNIIVDNNITGNIGHGLEFGGSSNNTIYRNRFIDNRVQIYPIPWKFPSFNLWDAGSQGNYWSDYNGTDADGDCVGDTPYVVDGNNQDRYPLMEPYANPKIPDEEQPSAAATLIAASAAAAAAGATALIYFKKRRRQTQNTKENAQTT